LLGFPKPSETTLAEGTVSLEKALVSAGVGIVDIGMRELDFQEGWNVKQLSATNIYRGAVLLLSIFDQMADKNATRKNITEVAFYSDLPLFEDTLYVLAKNALAGTTISRVVTQPSVVVTPAVTSAPVTGAGGGGTLSKTY
jgi:hypothetical protein